MINLGNDYLYKFLGDLGYTGNLNDRWYDYLRDQGLTGTVNDMLYKLLVAFGFTGSVDDMWNKYIDSNNGIFTGFEKLRLDFTRGTLDPRITFSRTSNATITKSDGTIGYAPHNLLTHSEQFDNAAWTKASLTVTANNTTAPDNTTTADKLVEGVGSVQPIIYRSISTVLGNNVISYYLKAGERTWARIYTGANLSSAAANFNLVTGVVGTTSNVVSANIVSVGNGWYRCSVTALATLTSSANAGIQILSGDTTAAYTGDGTSGLYIWGAQLEIGSTATTYNPTTVKNLLGYTEAFDNAAWTKSNSFIQSNLLTFSEAFDNAAWSKTGATITANVINAPNGYQTADRIVESAVTNVHQAAEAATLVIGVTYTYSIYAKAGERNWIWVNSNDGTNRLTWFNLSTGVVGTTASGVTATITPASDGYYRLTATVTATGTSGFFVVGLATGDNVSNYLGDITKGAYIWGAQLVQGSVAGDYRRTDAAALPVFYPNHNGVVCAEKLVENTVNNVHGISVSNTVGVANGTTVFSLYCKAAERTKIRLLNTDNATGGTTAIFDLLAGTATYEGMSGNYSAGSASIQSVGNGVYRCSISATKNASGNTNVTVIAQLYTTTNSYTGDGTSGIYIFGAQLSDSASLDPYVLNAAAAPSAQAYYGARFDYDPVTLAPKGLLIEEQRVNLCLRSDDLNNASWTAFNSATLTNNSTISPDGTQNADTINFAANATSQYYQLITAGSATYTFSVWAKVESGTGTFRFKINNGSTDSYSSNNTVTTTWQRFTYTLTSAVANIGLVNGTDATIKSIIFWGAQLEAGAFATSYIPTAASQVTRAADVATIQGSNFYSWYNRGEGTLNTTYFFAAPTSGSINKVVAFDPIAAGGYATICVAGGLNTGWFVSGLNMSTANAGVINKQAIAYNSWGGFSGALNNVLATPATTSDYTGASTALYLGQRSSGQYMNGTIKQISYYPQRLSDSVLKGLTA